MANPHPHRSANAYPHAYEMVAQLFDHPAAPDVVTLHTPAHNWEDHGGERGEHGSMSAVQARAPFILAGAGVKPQGMVARSCKLVDVAPTVLALMGAAPHPEAVGLNGSPIEGGLLRRQDGQVLQDLFEHPSTAPDHVVGFLDGCNPNVLYDAIALRARRRTSPACWPWGSASSTALLVDAHRHPAQPHHHPHRAPTPGTTGS